MTGELIDTNILTRFFIGDNPEQHKKAEKIFREAELGKRKLRLTVLVTAEVVFVLESFYKRQRQEITEFLEVFISQRWLTVENRKILQNVWPWYLQGFHLVDSFLLAWGKANNEKILTFDKKLKKAVAR